MNIRTSIIKTIVYFDIFDFPLMAEEIMEYLYGYSKPIHIKEIKGTLELLIKEGKIEKIREYFVLNNRGNIIETRKSRKFISEKFWSRTRLYGRYMKMIPFVKMIAVCNNLAYNNASPESDIDLLIVIKSGRMWTARLLITIILHFFGVRRHGNLAAGRFCLSFFITEKKLSMEELAIDPHDPYLAYWTKLIAPIYGQKTYNNFVKSNEKWLSKKYGINFTESSSRHIYLEKESKFKKLSEWILNGKIGNILEEFLKKTLKKKTLRSMKKLGSEASVIVSDDILKFHNKDKRRKYYERWIM